MTFRTLFSLFFIMFISGLLRAQMIPGIKNENIAQAQLKQGDEITPNVQSRLVVDGTIKNFFQWVFYQSSNQPIYIEKTKLIQNLSDVIKSKYLKILSKNNKKYISSRDLKELGIESRFNESTLDIEVKIPPKVKKEQIVNLVGRGLNKEDSSYVLRNNKFSSYLNVFGSQAYQDIGNGYEQGERRASLEFVNHLYGLTIENDFDYNSINETPWRRDKTRLIYDFEKSLTRLQIGDITRQAVGRQRQFQSLGVSYSKVLSINPRFLRTNIHTNQIILERPSVVDVFINGNLIKRDNFQPGPVDIRDFPFFSGENTVLIRVTDDLGRVQEEYFNDYFAPQLLRENVAEFDVSIEAPRSTDLTQDDKYETDKPFLSAFYRQGLTKKIVAGAYTQINEDEQLLGLESTIINKFGVSRLELAASQNNILNKPGVFAGVELSTLLFRKGKLTPYSLNTLFQYRSPFFFSQSDDIRNIRNTRFLLDMSVRQNHRSSLQSSYGFRRTFNDSDDHNTTYFVSSSWNINQNLQLSIRASSAFREEETDVLISLYWGDRAAKNQVFATFDPERETVTTRYQHNPLYQLDSIRYTAGSTVNPSSYSLEASAEYYHRRFNTRLTHSSSFLKDSVPGVNDSSHLTELSGAFAIAFAGKAMAITRPITNGFIIVGTDKNIETDQILINRYVNRGQTQIDPWGPGVLSNITPYFNEKVRIDTSDLPVGVSLEEDHFIARLAFKSGLHIKAKVVGFAAIQGTLLNPKGQKIPLEVGSVIKINDDLSRSEVGRFFTNDQGGFFVEKLKDGNYKLELDNTELSAHSFSIKKGFVGVKELEKIQLKYSQKIIGDE